MESIFSEFFTYDIRKKFTPKVWTKKRAQNAKIAKLTFKCVDLAEIHDSVFGLSKCIEWIFICGICLTLFLVVECKNSIENISITMRGMVFSSIKSWADRRLNQNIIKSLKIHK